MTMAYEHNFEHYHIDDSLIGGHPSSQKMSVKPYKPKILSLFTGCGGLDLGFHMAGYETIWANDVSEWACESFKKNIGNVIVHGDIEQINPYDKSIPDCDIILGGFRAKTSL